MRLITITLAILLILIQYPLWIGKGGFFRVRELNLQLNAAREKNEEHRLRNTKLASEVRDLEVGTEAIEERARYELGMIKKDEVFIQIIDTSKIPDKNRPITGSVATGPQGKAQALASDTNTEVAAPDQSASQASSASSKPPETTANGSTTKPATDSRSATP